MTKVYRTSQDKNNEDFIQDRPGEQFDDVSTGSAILLDKHCGGIAEPAFEYAVILCD